MREFLSPKFVTCFVVLVVAAIGMRPTIGALSDTFSKHPVEIRTSLLEFDLESLPSYVAVPDGERYTGASEEDLGLQDRGGKWVPLELLHHGQQSVDTLSGPRHRLPGGGRHQSA